MRKEFCEGRTKTYFIDETGTCYAVDKKTGEETIRQPRIKNGYYKIVIEDENRNGVHNFIVDRLMYKFFIDPEEKMARCHFIHKDGNPLNFAVDNIEPVEHNPYRRGEENAYGEVLKMISGGLNLEQIKNKINENLSK